MRLIDADKIYQILENKSSYGYVSALDISSIEIVDAIPVEWILKWACEFIDPNSEGYKMAMELVHDWRIENEENI